MKAESVLVTGSDGLIGAAVMRRFSGRFDSVVGFDRKAPKPPPPGCVYIPVEITSDEGVREGLRTLREHHGAQVVSVIHLAAYYDFSGEPSPKYDEITVPGSQCLLRGLPEASFQVASSSSQAPCSCTGRPSRASSSTKTGRWSRPGHIRSRRSGPSSVSGRSEATSQPYCCASPESTTTSATRFRWRTRSSASTSGSSPATYILARSRTARPSCTWTTSSGRHRARRGASRQPAAGVAGADRRAGDPVYDELQHTLARLIHGESWETFEIPKPLAKAGAWLQEQVPGEAPFIKPWMIDRANDNYAFDITRARTLLDWEPRRSLRGTLPAMVAALKADPVGWYRENKLELPSALREGAAR